MHISMSAQVIILPSPEKNIFSQLYFDAEHIVGKPWQTDPSPALTYSCNIWNLKISSQITNIVYWRFSDSSRFAMPVVDSVQC